MEHDVAVDGVVFRISTAHGTDGTAEIALLVQNIIELDTECQGITFQQRLRYLCVPKKLIGVQRCIIISAAALFMKAGRYAHVPRQGQVNVRTVSKLPCVEVACRLKVVLCMSVVQ